MFDVPAAVLAAHEALAVARLAALGEGTFLAGDQRRGAGCATRAHAVGAALQVLHPEGGIHAAAHVHLGAVGIAGLREPARALLGRDGVLAARAHHDLARHAVEDGRELPARPSGLRGVGLLVGLRHARADALEGFVERRVSCEGRGHDVDAAADVLDLDGVGDLLQHAAQLDGVHAALAEVEHVVDPRRAACGSLGGGRHLGVVLRLAHALRRHGARRRCAWRRRRLRLHAACVAEFVQETLDGLGAECMDQPRGLLTLAGRAVDGLADPHVEQALAPVGPVLRRAPHGLEERAHVAAALDTREQALDGALPHGVVGGEQVASDGSGRALFVVGLVGRRGACPWQEQHQREGEAGSGHASRGSRHGWVPEPGRIIASRLLCVLPRPCKRPQRPTCRAWCASPRRPRTRPSRCP